MVQAYRNGCFVKVSVLVYVLLEYFSVCVHSMYKYIAVLILLSGIVRQVVSMVSAYTVCQL